MSLQKDYPLYLANEPQRPNSELEVTNKYTGDVETKAALADAQTVERAIAAADQARHEMAALEPYQRQQVLEHCVERFHDRQDELAEALCIEAGKPITFARGEVTRLIDTFKQAAAESVRVPGGGEVMPLAISERASGRTGMWKRVPIGPCSFISPFNFPLNLAAHKMAPAIAAGCPFVLKPASRTPVGALIIGELLAETDLPKGAFSILPCKRETGEPLTTDPRLKLLSFTGSDSVGWDLKARAGKKRVILELGGNAAAIVDETIQGEHLDDAVQRMVFGAFYQSGQSCISVQRVLLHRDIYDTFKEKFLEAVRNVVVGDPMDEATFVGPLIDDKAAQRVETWINEASDSGAKVLCGGTRDGRLVQPTVLENVPKSAKLWAEEAFGPVVDLAPFDHFDHALDEVNDSRFGLQAGVFTRDLYRTQQAWDTLEVGGVLINDVPSWRVDHMPYGGVKDSGQGREGTRWSIEDMTEPRLLAIRDPDQ